ncbi:MAG TPA: PHB depolymerase family esterase [Planctomycetota bacterium]|nr:PHB depolymerase family esterase [Planctomycetota bacterium]
MLLATLALWALAVQADKLPPFEPGASDVTFEKSSPLGEIDVMKARFHFKVEVNPYNVAQEKFRMVIPKPYTHGDKWGLFVYVNPGDGAGLPDGYEAILEKHRLIAVAAYKTGNERNVVERFRLALDAQFNMVRRFNIDPARVYVSGFSGGGRIASMLGVAYADLFPGAIPFCGVNFYTSIPSEPGKVWPPNYSPASDTLRTAKSTARYVLVTGEKDMNLKNTQAVYDHGFKKEGFKHALLMEVPGMGHSPPPAESFDKGLDFLDTVK